MPWHVSKPLKNCLHFFLCDLENIISHCIKICGGQDEPVNTKGAMMTELEIDKSNLPRVLEGRIPEIKCMRDTCHLCHHRLVLKRLCYT